MNPIALILLWIFILALILLSTPTKCPALAKQTEGFEVYPYYSRRYCPSCSWRSRSSCGQCVNCGYKINAAGYGQCTAGDANGPYYDDDAMYWLYGTDSEFYSPYSNIFPVVKVRSMFPYYNWSLRKPSRTLRSRSRVRRV